MRSSRRSSRWTTSSARISRRRCVETLPCHNSTLLTVCSKVIPRAIDYFTGKALEYEDFDDEDDFEDLDDDEDDEDDFEDDVCLYPVPFFCGLALIYTTQDSDSDAEPPARRRGPPKGRGAGATAGSNPEECKQQ